MRARADGQLARTRLIVEGPQGPRLRIGGRDLLSFCSNDYLGLANHPRVREALARAAADFGVGAGASHLVTGHTRWHEELEIALARFVGRERALLFSTGYMANIGTVSALLSRGDEVFADRLVHASLLDGARLSGARLRRYAHADPERLDDLLSRDPGASRRLVLTDGVFSMDGDLAPLPELAAVCARRGAWLMVDDAHGLGVLGDRGGGCVAQFGLGTAEVPILVGTLGKAFGTFGAFVAGDAPLVETLIQRARSYIYTTALPASVAAATLAALALVEAESWRREQLRNLVARFRRGAHALGLRLPPHENPIQPLVLGSAPAALAASRSLLDRGIHVAAIRPPTVPEGTARLRFSFSAAHGEEDIDRLLEALAACRADEPVLFSGDR
ncbi:MAG: 8-amino-7-oxononanoate synthase [Gammaproteobacteria bacterium]|nr:8-amino-7-oxononanoate synthase [Gammaproteobacteria bacterium]